MSMRAEEFADKYVTESDELEECEGAMSFLRESTLF
jgi:hypothetical protein